MNKKTKKQNTEVKALKNEVNQYLAMGQLLCEMHNLSDKIDAKNRKKKASK